jgi:hypothetical protein
MSDGTRRKGSTVEVGDIRSPLRWGLVALTLAPVLVLTLRPAPDASWVGGGLFCILCGHSGTANLIRNVVLFVPLGVALALLVGARSRAVVAALFVTAMIEALQFEIPGRNPGLTDLLANVSGAALAVTAVRWSGQWLSPGARAGAFYSLGFGGLASGVMAATAFLFMPDLPRTSWFAHLGPDLEHLERYGGEVRSAHVGGVPLRVGVIEGPDRIRGALLEGGSVEVEAMAGPAPSRLSPLFMITSGAREEMLLVGAHGPDLVGRVRLKAVPFGFDRPDLRARGAFRDVPVGSRLDVVFEPRGGDSCLTVNDRAVCGLGPGIERGWALLMYPGGAPSRVKSLFDFVWMMGLLLPFGFFARAHPSTFAAGALLVVAATSGSWLGAIAPLGLSGAFGMLAGAVAGHALRRWAERGAASRG